MEKLSSEYWNKRYQDSEVPWDLKTVSSPIKAYIDQLKYKTISILIPGCGNGYEGEYLLQQGFTNIHLLDFANEPIESFQRRNSDFPKENLHIGDFFKHEGKYDLIFEQTLFCAINPDLRPEYAKKSSELLKSKGKIVGVMFNRVFENGPPFGGNKEEYLNYFNPYFSNIYMEKCYNSISARQGSELFIKLEK